MFARGSVLYVALFLSWVLFSVNFPLFSTGGAEISFSHRLNFALAGNPDTLDPHATSGTLTYQVLRSVYDTLAEPDRDGRIVPALAERWNISEDGLRWTFFLRQEVFFHNGDRLDSDDVIATINRLRESNSPFSEDFAMIASMTAPDNNTFVIILREPHAPLLATLASGWSAILPKRLIKEKHNFARSPIGTGPFMLKEWIPNSRITLTRNQRYWKSPYPYLDRLDMHIVTEPSLLLQGLIGGTLDIVYILEPDHINRLEANSEIRIERFLSSLVMVLALNTERPPLNNPIVREALNRAIDKQSVLDIAYGGGEPIASFIDYGSPYYNDFTHLYPYDIEKAKSLLRDANIPEDLSLEIVIPQNYAPHARAGEIYQQMLSDIGLQTTIRLVDWPVWLDQVYTNAQYDMTVIGHTGRLDPDTRFGEYTYVRWNSDRLIERIATARRTFDFNRRAEIYREAFEIMAQEVPFVFVGTSYRNVAINKRVSGFHMDNVLDTFDFREVQLR